MKTAIAENSNSNVNQHAQNHHFQKYKTVLVADAGAVFCWAFGGATDVAGNTATLTFTLVA